MLMRKDSQNAYTLNYNSFTANIAMLLLMVLNMLINLYYKIFNCKGNLNQIIQNFIVGIA